MKPEEFKKLGLKVGDEVTNDKDVYIVRLIGEVDGDLMCAMSDSDRIKLYKINKLNTN